MRRFLTLAVVAVLSFLTTAQAFEGFIGLTNGYFYDKTTGESFVPHGIAYQTWNRPLGVWQTFDQIDYDLDEMVKMGANSVRIDIVWQHAEEKGDNIFSWENYDYFMDACEKRGLRIFALIGYQWPPNWFPDEWYTMHPPAVDAEGIAHTNRWQSDIINYEHPDARAQYAEWIGTVAARYKDEKSIVGWIVGNESGYLGLWSGLLDGYDPETEQAFRVWTSNKYETVSAANEAWGTDYESFDDIVFVEQYRAYGPEGAQWADMVQFREDSIASFTAVGAVAAKQADTNHLVSYSTVGMQWGEEDWRYHAEDRGKITAVCEAQGAPIDFFSVNNYPWSVLGHESQNGHWGISYTKKVAGVPVVYSETGFTSSETMWPGMDEDRQGPLVRNSLWESLEAGAIGTHIFSWMDRPYITDREKGFGIVNADRRIKPAFWTSRDTFTIMDQVRIQNLLMDSDDPTPDIAFLWTDAVDSQYNRYECEMQQIAGALERIGYEPNFIDLQDLADGVYTNFRVIILPRNMRVEDTVPGYSNSILNFIETQVLPAGIHVIASADLPGMQNANGQPRAEFEAEVDSLFGIDAGNIGGEETPQRVTVFVSWNWKPIDITFTSNAVGAVANNYNYTAQTWKYSDEIEVTDGELWATMDVRRNKGFEDSDSSVARWDGTWGDVHVRSGWGWAYEGNNMVQMWGESGMWKDFSVLPHGRYSHGAYLRSNNDDPLRGGAYAWVGLEWYDEDDNLLSVSRSAPLTGSTDGQWVEYLVDTTAPDDSFKARRVTRIDRAAENLLSNGGLSGSGDAPDSWSSWNSGNHDPDTAIYRSSGNSWAFWYEGGIYQDFTGFAPGDVVRAGGFLYTPDSGDVPVLSNGGFEDDANGTMPPTSWTKTGSGATWTTTIGFSDAGTNCVKIYQGWNSQTTTLSQALSASEGDEWTASAKIYDWSSSGNTLSSGDEAFVRLEWLDAGGTNIGTSLTSAKITSASGQDAWHHVAVTGTAPAGVASARIVLALGAGPNNDVLVFFDSASLTKTVVADPLRNGTKHGVVELEFYSGDTKLQTVSAVPTINADSPKSEWVYTEASAAAPAGADSARVVVRCNDYDSGDGRFMVDDLFAINDSRFANSLANAGLEGSGDAPNSWSQWNSGSHDSDCTVARSGDNSWVFWWDGGIYQDVANGFSEGDEFIFGAYLYTPDPVAAENSLSHGGFEGDAHGSANPTDWTKTGSGAVWIQTVAFADEGTNTLKIYQGWNSQATLVYQDVSAQEGETWVGTAKFYDWSSSGNVLESGDEAYFTLEWLDGSSSRIGTAVESAKVTSSSGQDAWHELSVTSTAPAGTVSARISPTLKAGPNNNVVIFVDSVSLVKESDIASDPLRGGDKNGVVQLEIYDGATKLSTVSATPTINSSSDPNMWIRSEGSATIPAGADKLRLVVRCNDYSSGDGRFMADDAFLVNMTPGGSVYVDGKAEAPALVVKDHGPGKGKAAIFLYGVGDNNPDGDEDGEMDILPWAYRYDIFSSLVRDYFEIEPSIQALGSNAFLCLPEYRICTNGMKLLQVKNYWYDPELTNGGDGLTFTLNSSIFSNKTVEGLLAGSVLEHNSDGTIDLWLEPDGMEMLLVYETSMVKQIVRIANAPGLVHPLGDDAYEVAVKYDCLDRNDLTLNVAFQECGDNGDGVADEIYQLVTMAVSGSGEARPYVYIPDPNSQDEDYISSSDGGQYQFTAWLTDASSNVVVSAVPQAVQLKWGISVTNELPQSLEKGDSFDLQLRWEDIHEYLSWENTPMMRNESFPARVAIFRSSKTEALCGGHFDAVNAVCDWLESMGYSSGNPLDLSFDNVTVTGLFSDDFNDGNMDGWTRIAGCGNWQVSDSALRATRIGNDDNIVATGSVWTNYTASVDIRYKEQGPYFNDAELYVRFQDRDNFVKVGIRNFYGFWRLKYSVRVATNTISQGWLHDFPKTNAPTTNVTYNLRVNAQDDVFTVYFNDVEVGSFSDTNFPAGKIALGTKAVQLGICDPQKGYYFIDDDEYSYYSPDEQASVTLGYPLDLDWGYLDTFFPTLILPGTYVMSDVEVSNVIHWAGLGMKSLIATDGGIASKDESGAADLGRIESLFGMCASIRDMTNLNQAVIGDVEHYVVLDYAGGDTLNLTGSGCAWSAVDDGASLGVAGNGVDAAAPAFICNTIGDDPDAPNKVFCFNFRITDGGMLTNELATIAQRAFEWTRGQATKVTLELKYGTDDPNAMDFVVYKTTGWLLGGSGTASLAVNLPTNNIMTGDRMYWVLYTHEWDSEDPYLGHAGFYSSKNDGSEGLYTSIEGVGLQILGITDTAYAGRDWDKWIAYNTRTQDMVLVYGLKDKGLLDEKDNFNGTGYSGWTVQPHANVSWSVTNGVLRAVTSGTGGVSVIERNGLELSDTNITVQYDVFFDAGATSGGIVYRGVKLDVNPGRCGWVDDSPDYYTNNLPATGAWEHVVITIRGGNPHMRSDLRVGTNMVFVGEEIETTNFTSDTAGFVASVSGGTVKWDNFALDDELYAVVWAEVSGISFPTNDVPTGTWPSIPDYDPDHVEHGGTMEGAEYEWFINFRGEHDVHAEQDVSVYFAPRLCVEDTNFPLQMARGETVNVPIEWEGIGTTDVVKLGLVLENPYTGTNVARGVFDITNSSGQASFGVTVDLDAVASKDYAWVAYFYPPAATNPMLQRVGLDDTFRYQPVVDGSPIKPETQVEVTSITAGDYVVYSDAGIPAGANIYTWCGGSGVWDADYTLFPAPEGSKCFYTLSFIDYIGWGIFNTSGVDMSAFTNGYLRFYLYSQETLKAEIEDMNGVKGTRVIPSTGATWQDVSIALTNFPSVDFSNIKGFFMITSYDGALYLVDQVRWTQD